MNTPTDWLLAAVIVVITYFIIVLADNILQRGAGIGQKFWRRHIVDDFPYPDKCWTCRKGSCRGCDLLKRGNGF